MATLITSANMEADIGSRVVFDVSGTPYVVLYVPSYAGVGCIAIFKKTNGSFSEQDSSNRPEPPDTYTYISKVDARLDGTLIKIAYNEHSSTNDFWRVRYVTFNTSSDTWGTPETAISEDYDYCPQISTSARTCKLGIDSSGYPFIAWGRNAEKYHGSFYANVYMIYKTSGGWQSIERVSTDEEVDHYLASVVMASDDRFIVIYGEAGVGFMHRSRSSGGTWDTENLITTGVYEGSIAVDSSDVRKLGNGDANTPARLDALSGTSGANPTWSTEEADIDTNVSDPSTGVKSGGTDRYILYVDMEPVDYTVRLAKRENGSYSHELLQSDSVDLDTPIIENPVRSTGFHYIWHRTITDVWYYDEYTFGNLYYQSAGGGSVGIAGTLSKIPNKLAGQGSVAIAGDLSSLPKKLVGQAAVTIAGALAKKMFESVGGGSVGIAGILTKVKRYVKAVGGGSVGVAGDLVKLPKKLAGQAAVSIAGILKKKTSITVGEGSVGIAGVLTAVKKFFRAVGQGAVGIAGDVVKLPKKLVGQASVSIAGVLTRKTSIDVGEGSVGIAGSLTAIKKFFRTVGQGSVGIAGSLLKKTATAVGEGAVGISGALIKKVKITVGEGAVTSAGVLSAIKRFVITVGQGAVGIAGNLGTQYIPGGGVIYQNVGGGLVAISGTLTKLAKKRVGQGTVPIIGSLYLNPKRLIRFIIKILGGWRVKLWHGPVMGLRMNTKGPMTIRTSISRRGS